MSQPIFQRDTSILRQVTELSWGQLNTWTQSHLSDDLDDLDGLDIWNDQCFGAFEAGYMLQMGGLERANEAACGVLGEVERDVQTQNHHLASVRECTAKYLGSLESRLRQLSIEDPPQNSQLGSGASRDAAGVLNYSHIYRHLQAVNDVGQITPKLDVALQTPKTTLKEEVSNHVHLNTSLDEIEIQLIPPLSRQQQKSTSIINNSQRHSEPSNLSSLFSHFRSGLCDEEHSALLNLCGVEEGQSEFRMLLGCGSAFQDRTPLHGFHPTVCIFESEAPKNDTAMCLKVCVEKKKSELYETPLRLHFSQSSIWSSNDLDIIMKDLVPRTSMEHLPLERLFLRQLPSSSNSRRECNVRKFRLAKRLALSLHEICLEPWMQDIWTVGNVYIPFENEADPWLQLDEPRILSHFVPENETRKMTSLEWFFVDKETDLSPFLLSFAQLLIDIEKGGSTVWSRTQQTNVLELSKSLTNVARDYISGELTRSFGLAVLGCVRYSLAYHSHRKSGNNESSSTRTAIKAYIAKHLSDQLDLWDTATNTKIPSVQAEGATGRYGVERDCKALALDPGFKKYHATYTLFSDEDGRWPEWNNDISKPDTFTQHMRQYINEFIIRRSENICQRSRPNVRIAVLDTGFSYDPHDSVLRGGRSRIKDMKDFTEQEGPALDGNGHGTQVTRLLLRFAPEADIYVVKISDSKVFDSLNIAQLAEALRWAGDNADVINLSFGLGKLCPMSTKAINLQKEIQRLVMMRKLIFAAASNTGGNGYRSWPSSEKGVFCIHAADEQARINHEMNPFPLGSPDGVEMDNFATLGDKVKSQWKDKATCISGTSFATPVAAAIAANVLEFARTRLDTKDADAFMRHGVMRKLFRRHMTDNGDIQGVYHYLKPWRKGLWEPGANENSIAEALRDIVVYE